MTRGWPVSKRGFIRMWRTVTFNVSNFVLHKKDRWGQNVVNLLFLLLISSLERLNIMCSAVYFPLAWHYQDHVMGLGLVNEANLKSCQSCPNTSPVRARTQKCVVHDLHARFQGWARRSCVGNFTTAPFFSYWHLNKDCGRGETLDLQ